MADEGAPANVFGTVPDTVRVKGGASGERSITVIESGNSRPRPLLASPSLALTMRSSDDDVTYGGESVPPLSTVEQPVISAANAQNNAREPAFNIVLANFTFLTSVAFGS